jgi:hypothetical protein
MQVKTVKTLDKEQTEAIRGVYQLVRGVLELKLGQDVSHEQMQNVAEKILAYATDQLLGKEKIEHAGTCREGGKITVEAIKQQLRRMKTKWAPWQGIAGQERTGYRAAIDEILSKLNNK